MENLTTIPIYLEADSKELLVKKMIENNFENKTHYKYFCPIKDKGTWVVWYYKDVGISLEQKLQDVKNGSRVRSKSARNKRR